MDYNFTAKIEKELDSIARGELIWSRYAFRLYTPFHKTIIDTRKCRKSQWRRYLGNHPESGEPVFVKLGKYGPIAQIGDTADETKKPKFASLQGGSTY